ncbi:uncharacterized protein LOC129585247 [Paramacrobiotus metropolitanus]|uniref:uncharacterized protein LOC129585247 n=1 Tax=Paramacrobiotus metropolitanus TaxID=2943436 RepID=UPI002445CAFC|nr:uncharacterized protein LOC129585247 [Paramacrobiotus metropolitanus]XP_055333839.1 uncharacterized protein LOC129585247 [Paramacrobiotus metropolitanus]XP_055333840.1 uncharacterized protein LOC129585247 [Paramacrobiotus metropolitanus]XP_055333841.1 uncharacterized protein LOC129585247 [Paramacrobiotus metropolitanus]
MDLPWRAMQRYRPVLTDANQISYQNTVVVRNPNDTCWLGYIQDMDGDRAFIHFDSTKVTARWIHMSSIWLLPFYWENSGNRGCDNVPVHVALRDEEDGPLRFRPATLVGSLVGCDNCHMFYITSFALNSNAHAAPDRAKLVEMGQIAAAVPPHGRFLLERSVYSKHFIPFARVQSILTDASDKFRIIMHLRNAFRAKRSMMDCCRFHLRIERDGCMFITIHLAGEDAAQWTTTALLQVLNTHLADRINLPAIRCGRFAVCETISCECDWEIDALQPAARISQLTPFLLSDILAHLDLHSQMTAQRVCALWQLLLSSPRMADHISISVASCWQLQVDSNNCYKLAGLLAQSITRTTVSLTFLDALPTDRTSFLLDILDRMQTRLLLIGFRDQMVCEHGSMAGQKQHRLKHTAPWVPLSYKRNCRFVALYNWTVSRLFGFEAYEVFHDLNRAVRRLPEHEQKLMKHLTPTSRALRIDQMSIRIPRLLLRCSDGKMHMTSRFMSALNEHCPPITEEMLAKVTAVYERWVRSLQYPDEWQTIRQYLSVFSGFNADGSPRLWQEVDLRLLDASTLSKLAMYGIDEIFAV